MSLYNPDSIEHTKKLYADWEKNELNSTLDSAPELQDHYQTVSGTPIERIYTPDHVRNLDYESDLGFPGAFPFSRGVYPTMYRGRLWTRRQIAGFGTAQSTNQRYKFLLAHGQTGISTDFDHPTLTGYDSFDPVSEGEVGRLGVAIDSLPDMADLFDDIPLNKVSISLTINHPAIVLLSMLLAHSEDAGISWELLRGTVQNDSLKEFHGQKTYALEPRGAYRMTMDVVEFCTRHVPGWNTISISGYHTREAGSSAAQELAFTLAQAMAYVDGGLQRGMTIDDFGPRLAFFFGCHMDFFEEVAKMRAARRMWARITRKRYGAVNPKAMLMRFHTQTLGSTLIREGALNNIIRGTSQAMAAVLGGTQSLHVSGYDEAYDIPSEDAMRMSLNTQRIVGAEMGITNTIDPLAGSFFVEHMTNLLEEQANQYLETIESMGNGSMLNGMFEAIDSGYIEREIAQSAYEYQLRLENDEYVVLGLNDHVEGEAGPHELYEHDPEEETRQLDRVATIMKSRDGIVVQNKLEDLRSAARGNDNLVPFVLGAVKAHATEGEIMGIFREVFGEYRDPGVL